MASVTATAAAAAADGEDVSPSDLATNNNLQQELPFLVTHWLANYGTNSADTTTNNPPACSQDERQEAMARIRRATSEIASAFATLGAYGTTFRPAFSSTTTFARSPAPRNSSYGDVSRRHAGLPPSHLEHLAQSAALYTAEADDVATKSAPVNLLLQSGTRSETDGTRNGGGDQTLKVGRSLQDDNFRSTDDTDKQGDDASLGLTKSLHGSSIFQRPLLLLQGSSIQSCSSTSITGDAKDRMLSAERTMDTPPVMSLKAAQSNVDHEISEAIRALLSARENEQSLESEIHNLKASFALHQRQSNELKNQIVCLDHNSTMSAGEKTVKSNELAAEQQGCDRVMSQLGRKLDELTQSLGSARSSNCSLEATITTLHKQRRVLAHNFHNPFAAWGGPLSSQSRVGGCGMVRMVMNREHGLSRTRFLSSQPHIPRSMLRSGLNPGHFKAAQRYMIECRLSHAVTINTHLNSPIYCLRFDRTGRYFVTGADDYLVKVFCLGAAQSCRTRNGRDGSRRLRCSYGANFRGAVLVCSLRGHAGVINDIDVSSDNSFLATASTDGDVRIWGLKDGCPVAILRGHKNGANMVSWSQLTPYRLVTTGSDGFARLWDIREACMKRYGKIVGNREEYRLHLTEEEQRLQQSHEINQIAASNSGPVNLLPPLPQRDENSAARVPADVAGVQLASGPPALPPLPNPENVAGNGPESANYNDVPVPPLPGAGPQLGADRNELGIRDADGQDEIAPGEFVANDLIDEGVNLVAKYQHGNSRETLQQGPGTRARRAAVNVICVARCPLGCYFATGSDDGIVRVWQDFDDTAVAVVDRRHSRLACGVRSQNLHPTQSGIENKPLLKLTGHVSTVTDLYYAHAGDRILSASQKDGVVRIWSVSDAIGSHGAEKRVSQLVIKLTDPSSKKTNHSSRRRPGNAAASPSSKVSCDVAVWTHDDSMIVTSQSVLLKQNGSEIKPGSQYICLWSSTTGICLMGISGAHTMPCNVVIPHPSDASLICTASADGFAKIWDLGQGRCIFSHQNKLEFGPVDANSTGGSYLDGAFSPDGSVIVLTDDSGQVSVFDSIAKQDNPSNNGNALFWMREQYFSNDYYDLFYDTSGYCIEKGSQKPPHLAPKSRITHKGSSFPGADEITETFKMLTGPLPLSEDGCRWRRENIRLRNAEKKISIADNSLMGIRNIVRELDTLSTLIIKGVGHVDVDQTVGKRFAGHVSSTSVENSRSNESTRFNYLGYEDLLMREGADDDIPESDDEEFEPTAPSSRGRRLDGNLDFSEEENGSDDLSFNSRDESRRGRRTRAASANNASEERRVRAQRRVQRTNVNRDFTDIGSDDEMIAQFVSVNKTPCGPYLRDFTREGHLWKLKNSSDAKRVHRKWLSRVDSDLSYFGKKFYTPQCGDSVVYIPRAHYETIKEFPSLSPPWQDWPTGTAWPIVRCTVQNIRFRFPYEDYFRQRNLLCHSIVAIVTLQVTGIPESSTEQEFPWPKPSFIEPSTTGVFEVSIFENPHADFLIPEFLYSARLESLQKHLRERAMRFKGLAVDVFYTDDDPRTEDAEMEPWASSLGEIVPSECPSDIHLNDSGFGVLSVTGDNGDNFVDTASPWDLNTDGLMLTRPHLTDHETKSVLEALNSLLQNPDIANHFSMPVDQERYYDYGVMVEVPMDLMFVKRRLNNNYYGSKLSVVADLRLIRDNCIKYNTAENEISQTAITMCEDFERKILSPDERSQLITEEQFEQIQKDQSDGRQSSNLRIRLSARTIRRDRHTGAGTSSAAASSSEGGRYSLRDRSQNRQQSSLEVLPAPEDSAVASNRVRTSRWDRESSASFGARETRGGRYSLRGQGISNRTETLARLRASGSESRAERAARRNRSAALTMDDQGTRRSNRGNSDNARRENREQNSNAWVSRRSSRRRNNDSPDYHEVNSDDDENLDPLPARDRSNTERTRSGSSSRSNRRASGRERNTELDRNHETEDEEEESDHEDQSDHDLENDSDEIGEDSDPDNDTAFESRRRTRAHTGPPTSASGRSKRRASSELAQEYSGRRSSRKTAPRQTYMDTETSEVDECEVESSDTDPDSVEEDLTMSNSKRRSRRNRSAQSTDSDVSDESDFENAQRNSNRRKRGSKSARIQPAKKRKSTRQLAHNLPQLPPWPEIGTSNIKAVTKEILDRVSERDDQSIFSIPVTEAHPEVLDEYTNTIDNPMDLRTIAKERLKVHTSIKMLQDDLILMYQNCCTFNGPGTIYWNYARERWEELNDLFEDVCKDLGVLLPRRWKTC